MLRSGSTCGKPSNTTLARVGVFGGGAICLLLFRLRPIPILEPTNRRLVDPLSTLA